MSKNRTWTLEEKLKILQQLETTEISIIKREFNIAESLIYKWKKQFKLSGVEGLKPQYNRVDPAVRRLEQENRQLKELLGQLHLELEVKNTLLKKKN